MPLFQQVFFGWFIKTTSPCFSFWCFGSPPPHRPDPNVATLSQFSPRTLAPKTSGRVWNEMNGLGLDFGQVNPDISTTINSLIILPREAPTRPAIFNVSRSGTRGW